jgi:hypothetical protein
MGFDLLTAHRIRGIKVSVVMEPAYRCRKSTVVQLQTTFNSRILEFCLAAVLRPCQSAALSDDHQNDTCQQYSAGQIVRDLSSQYAKKIYDLIEEFVDDLAEHSNAPQEAGLACTIFPQLTALRGG